MLMFENHGFEQVMNNPIWSKIISSGLLLTNYSAVTHPSQPNYVAQLGMFMLLYIMLIYKGGIRGGSDGVRINDKVFFKKT